MGYWLFVVSIAALWIATTLGTEHRDFLTHADEEAYKREHPPRRHRGLMQIIISLALLAIASYIILSHGYQSQDKNWAYGTLGTIVGFWLKGSK
jgi:ABC-type Fe3+ transport system permease subunit